MIQFNKNILPRIKGTYIVGGSVRDLLLDRTPTDYDIAVTGNPEQYAKKLIDKSDGHLVRLGKPAERCGQGSVDEVDDNPLGVGEAKHGVRHRTVDVEDDAGVIRRRPTADAEHLGGLRSCACSRCCRLRSIPTPFRSRHRLPCPPRWRSTRRSQRARWRPACAEPSMDRTVRPRASRTVRVTGSSRSSPRK